MRFTCWSLICLLGSTDPAGRIRDAIQSSIAACFGISPDSTAAVVRAMALVLQKAPHVVFFGILGWLATRDEDPRRGRWFLLLGCVVCLAAELLQGLTDTRSVRLGDAVINVVAFGAVAGTHRLLNHRGTEKTNKPQCPPCLRG